MDNIINNLKTNKWEKVKKYITKKQIQWDILIDQINGVIHYLAYHNQLEIIKLIDKNIIKYLILQPNVEGDNIYHISARMNHQDMFIYFLEINLDGIYATNKLGNTPLFYLISDSDFIKEIVKKYKIRDHGLNDEYSLLEYYILSENYSMIKFLLKYLILNNQSNLSIFTTIETGHDIEFKISVIKILADKLDINYLNQKFLSPLITAIIVNELDIVKLLIELGADIDYSGPENVHNPLILAILQKNVQLIKILLKSGAKVDIRDKYFRTSLHYIFNEKNEMPIKIKRFMLNEIDNVNMVDNEMNSILNLLIHNDNWINYQDILEEKKLKIFLKNTEGVAPIDGIQYDDLDIFIELVYKSYISQLDLDINWKDKVDKKISLILENADDIESFKQYIRQKIVKGQSYPAKKTQETNIKIIMAPKTNISHFSAYTYNYICFLYYILNKYPEIKIPSLGPDQMNGKNLNDLYQELTSDYRTSSIDHSIIRSIIRDYVNHSPILPNHLIVWKNKYTYFISPYIVQGIHETLRKYPDTKFILLKLTIISHANFNHANILIYDVKNKYIERFDPYGLVPFIDSKNIDKLIKEFIEEYFSGVIYISPEDTTNGISFQIFSDEGNNKNYMENDPIGFCMAWCLWYVETRVNNPDVIPKILIERTIQKIIQHGIKFKDYIRNYGNHLDREKNKILFHADIPEKYWYSLHIPYPIYKKYLNYIREAYVQKL